MNNKTQESPSRSNSTTKDDRNQPMQGGDRSRNEMDETSGRHTSPRTDEDRESGNRSRQQK